MSNLLVIKMFMLRIMVLKSSRVIIITNISNHQINISSKPIIINFIIFLVHKVKYLKIYSNEFHFLNIKMLKKR